MLTGKCFSLFSLNLFLPVDSRAFVRLAILPRPILCAFVRASLNLTPEITKTKGALEAVCTPMLKSILGLENTKTVKRKSSVLLCVLSGANE